MDKKKELQPHMIAFGFDRATDEQSLEAFLRRFSDPELLKTLLPRIANEEITATVDFLTSILHKHLTEKEYHSLFLAEKAS